MSVKCSLLYKTHYKKCTIYARTLMGSKIYGMPRKLAWIYEGHRASLDLKCLVIDVGSMPILRCAQRQGVV